MQQEKETLQASDLSDEVIHWFFFFLSYSFCGTRDLQDTQQTYLWIQPYRHSHPDLQLSGLMSSCRITYCLPSGLQILSHCNGSIPPSQLGSQSKHTQRMHNACYPVLAHSFCRGGCVDKFKEHCCCFTDTMALNYYLSAGLFYLFALADVWKLHVW